MKNIIKENILIKCLLLFVGLLNLFCYNRVMRYKLEELSPKAVDYFYNDIVKKENYDLLDNFVIKKIPVLYGYNKNYGTWEFEGDILGFKRRIIKIFNNYGHLKTFKIISKRYFFDYDIGIHNIEYVINVEYEKVIAEDILIVGFIEKEFKKDNRIMLIAYSSKEIKK